MEILIAAFGASLVIAYFFDTRASDELRAWALEVGVEPRLLESRRSLRRRIDASVAARFRSAANGYPHDED